MRIILTGATGFIGKNLLRYLVSRDIEVFAVVRDPAKLERFYPNFSTAGVKVIEGDLREIGFLERLPNTVDAVVHLAAMLGAWNASKELIIETNVEATRLLFNWFCSSHCDQFIFFRRDSM